MKTITKKEERILYYIISFVNEHGLMPTQRQISEDKDIALGTVNKSLKNLRKKKYLKIYRGRYKLNNEKIDSDI